jgi:hypothetical protein
MQMKRSLLVMVAVALLVGGQAGAQGAGAPGGPLVAADGTVVLVQPVVASGETMPSGMEVLAVAPTGTVAWRHTLDLGARDLALAGDLVIVVVSGQGQQGSGSSATTATSTVVALQLTDGAEAWSATLDGNAMGVSVGGGQVYVVTVTPQAQSTSGTAAGAMRGRGGQNGNGPQNGGGVQGMRSLVALSSAGAVLWTLSLAS